MSKTNEQIREEYLQEIDSKMDEMMLVRSILADLGKELLKLEIMSMQEKMGWECFREMVRSAEDRAQSPIARPGDATWSVYLRLAYQTAEMIHLVELADECGGDFVMAKLSMNS